MTTTPRERPAALNFVPDVIAPKPKQQQLFDTAWRGMQSGDPEYLLWGGAAGPGKSWGLRWLGIVLLIKIFKEWGLRNVQAALFCVDYPRLKDRHVNAMKAMPAWLGKYNEQNHDFTLREEWGGGILSLRNLAEPSQYDSAQFAFEMVDELTELDRDQFEEIRIRKRWPGVPYSPFIAACNPRRKGLAWVRKLWIERDLSGEKDSALRGHHFWFLQALPQDNDSLPASYYDTLNSLGPSIKRALLEGDWYVSVDQAFTDFSRWKRDGSGVWVRDQNQDLLPWHVIPTDEVPEQWRRIASHDWGYDSPGHHLWAAVDPAGGVIIYREWQFRKLDPQDIAAGILYRQGNERITVTYADPAIWQERRHTDLTQDQINLLMQNGKGQLSKADQYQQAGLSVERANNARIAGKSRIHTLLKDRGDGVPYLRIMDCCPILINTLQNITKDPDKNEDVLTDYLADDDLRDDSFDALRYLLMGVPTKAVEPPRRRSLLDGPKPWNF
jgi:hypothetical protein